MEKRSSNSTAEYVRLETVPIHSSSRLLKTILIFFLLVSYPVVVFPFSWTTTSFNGTPTGGLVSSRSRLYNDVIATTNRNQRRSSSALTERSRSNTNNDRTKPPSSCTLFATNAQPITATSPSSTFYIRQAVYSDLNRVANILVQSFYGTSSKLVQPYLYLSELSRLQSNFPYDQSVPHRFFVAVHQETAEVIGFVDVDARPAKPAPSIPPRPYLSDLAVSLDHRRRGIARSLITRCERTVSSWGKVELYLRVEGENEAALEMYDGLGYVALEHAWFGVRDTTRLLRKEGLALFETIYDGKDDEVIDARNETSSILNDKDTLTSSFFLDYMV